VRNIYKHLYNVYGSAKVDTSTDGCWVRSRAGEFELDSIKMD
jgi:hypothetical protein